MSDNRRVYRAIKQAIMQLYPGETKGNTARMLSTLAAMVSGIVLGKSCQLPAIFRKAPDQAKADSRVKRYSRWIQNNLLPALYTRIAVPSGCHARVGVRHRWQRSWAGLYHADDQLAVLQTSAADHLAGGQRL
jgi:hypothetical protein